MRTGGRKAGFWGLWLAVGLLLLAWLLWWPVPVAPVAWQAPPAPALSGRYAINSQLATVERLGVGVGVGPETVAVAADGHLAVGYEDGRIVRFDAAGQHPQQLVNTGGRPLGLTFDAAGNLIVADAIRGLVMIRPNGRLKVLATSANDVPFKFTDDVDVASDGRMYFTDASSKFGPALHAMDAMLEHGGHGRLLRYDPATQKTTVLLSGLQFANGVALGPQDAYVLVNETGEYDIIRYWLKGPKAGEHEVFFANLPGIPDGISFNGSDTFWVALFAPRNALLDATSGYPWLRKMAFRLPQFLQPQPARHAFVLGLGLDGSVTWNLQDAGAGNFSPITGVTQHGNQLYLGSLTQDAFARYTLPSRSGLDHKMPIQREE